MSTTTSSKMVPSSTWCCIYICILLAAEKKCDIRKLKGLLSSEFEMKDLGTSKKILGMEIYSYKR